MNVECDSVSIQICVMKLPKHYANVEKLTSLFSFDCIVPSTCIIREYPGNIDIPGWKNKVHGTVKYASDTATILAFRRFQGLKIHGSEVWVRLERVYRNDMKAYLSNINTQNAVNNTNINLYVTRLSIIAFCSPFTSLTFTCVFV